MVDVDVEMDLDVEKQEATALGQKAGVKGGLKSESENESKNEQNAADGSSILTVEEIISELELYDNGRFPEQALLDAKHHQAELTKRFIEVLSDPVTVVEQLEQEAAYMLPNYLCFLLSEFRAKDAFVPLIQFLSNLPEEPADSLGDLLTDNFARIFADLFDGDVALLKALVENTGSVDVIRAEALNALVILWGRGALKREELIDFGRAFFSKLQLEPYSFVNMAYVTFASNLGGGDLLTELRSILEKEDRDSLFWSNSKPLIERCKMSVDASLAVIKEDPDLKPIYSAAAEMTDWYIFGDMDIDMKPFDLNSFDFDKSDLIEGESLEPILPIRHATPKVGRNELCPCGSGKKYKKCCL